jgi:hypothetical protein
MCFSKKYDNVLGAYVQQLYQTALSSDGKLTFEVVFNATQDSLIT